jgi:mannitol/fructose-specific phosphotransferase system IIA component (Ntr-type)
MIKLTEYLKKGNGCRIKTNVEAPERNDLLLEFGSYFFPRNEKYKEMFFKLIKKRENQGSTGIGKGFAIPHTRTILVDNLDLAIITTNGTKFNSIDGKLVYLAIGVIAPPVETCNSYLPILGTISQLTKKQVMIDLVERIKKEDISPEEIFETIKQYESN